jgi:phosphate:Na+ symporter
MMLVLSAMNAGIFTLAEAAPIVIGADLGTTSTVMIAAVKGTLEKRRVALSHFFFNCATNLLALLMLPLLLAFITQVLRINDPLYAVVAFHSIFNVMGIILFLPLLGRFEQFLKWLVPEQQGGWTLGTHIRQVPASVVEAATEAARKELSNLLLHAVRLNLHCFKLNPADIFPAELHAYTAGHHLYDDDYAALKRTTGEMLGYTYSVQGHAHSEHREDLQELTHINHAVRNVGYAAKFIKDIRHNLLEFRHTGSEPMQAVQASIHAWAAELYRALLMLVVNRNPELALEHYMELKRVLRAQYESLQQEIYRASGENKIDDEETASALNAVRAIYLSTTALLEAGGVLLGMEQDSGA